METAERIKKVRRRLRESHAIFGFRFGVRADVVSSWERGDRKPDRYTWPLILALEASQDLGPAEKAPSNETCDLPVLHVRRRWRNFWKHRNAEDYVAYPRTGALLPAHEVQLIQRAQQGDIAARNEVWRHRIYQVLDIVGNFAIPEHLVADAIQIGILELPKVIDRFDVGRHRRFSKTAGYAIWHAIHGFLLTNLFPIRLPCRSTMFRIRRALRACRDQVYARKAQRHRGMHPLVWATPIDQISEHEQPTVGSDNHEADDEDAKLCRAGLDTLDERERSIIIRRYGLFGEHPTTLAEIGRDLALTRERVRQLQASAEKTMSYRLRDARSLFSESRGATAPGKLAAVRKYLAQNPKAAPKEVAARFGVSTALVYGLKVKAKKRTRRARREKAVALA